MTTENTILIARENLAEAEAAITEFDRVQAGIADLKAKYAGVVFPVATTTGMKDAIAARAEADRIAADRRAADEKTNGIRREIDSYLDKMPDDELLEVLQFVQIEVLHDVIEA